MHRINSLGMNYQLSQTLDDKTKITTNQKSIIVNVNLDQISQAWYNWQMLGMTIQKAFDFLTPDEREFILTGIDSNEWNELFKEVEE